MKTNTGLLAILIACIAAALPAAAHAQIIVNATGGFNEYTLSGQPLATPLISSTNAFGAIAVSGSNLFIVFGGDGFPGTSSIAEYTTSGYLENDALVTGLDDPDAIAVSDDGSTLFVADLADGTVSTYDTTFGIPIQAPLISNLPGPVCVAVSGSNLFVLNSNYTDSSGTTGSIGLYTTDGSVVNAALVTGLDGPAFLALSGSDIYVACAGLPGPGFNYSFEGTVGHYSVSGTSGVTVTASLIHGLTTPQIVAVSGTDIFVTNNSELDEYNTSGIPWDPVNGAEFLPFAPDAIAVLSLAMLPGAIEVVVPGDSNPYLAGMPAGTTTGGDIAGDSTSTDPAVLLQSPVLVPGLTLTGSTVLTFSATGSVNYAGGVPTDPPDGTQPGGDGPENGISGFVANWDALVGVFLSATDEEDITTAPATLDFSGAGNVPGGMDYTTLAPALNQLFFIGDGMTSTGTTQQIVVPPGATRLYLGTTDGSGWYNNTGNFTVLITSTSAAGIVSGTTPPTVEFSITGPTTNGAIINFGATTTTGLKVRVQSSPDGTTWTDLPDNNSAAMTEDPNNPGNYSLNSTFYPAGNAVSFRAVATDSTGTDYPSPANGTYVLTRGVLSIGVTIASTSDPVHGSVTHIGDDLTYTFTVINSGSATARNLQVVTPFPTYIQNQSNIVTQFSSADIPLDANQNPMISSGFTYLTTTGTNQIVWSAGDLDAGNQLSETFTIHITSAVRTQQSLGLEDNYIAYSPSFQPPYSATGISSGSPGVSTTIEGPISFTMVPQSTTVAPGGLVTYSCTLTNLSSTYVKNVIAAVTVPDSMSYSSVYQTPTAKKKTLPGVAWAVSGLAPTPAPIEDFWTGSNPEIVIDVSALYPAGDPKHRNSVVLNVTFQAQWTAPTTISTINYGAALLSPATLYLNTKGKPVTEYDLFSAAFDTAGNTNAANLGPTDFFSFLSTQTNDIAVSELESGTVTVGLQGSLANEPVLSLGKAVSNQAVDTEDVGTALVNVVQPGGELTYILAVSNDGPTEADDVYVRDGLPDNVSYVSERYPGKAADETASEKASKVITTFDGNHVRFDGLKLKPYDFACIEYTVVVDSGAGAPGNGTVIDANSAHASTTGCPSIPETPEGLYNCGPVEVTGSARFAQPVVRTMVPAPVVSTDFNATANVLNTFYNNPKNDVPITSGTDPTSYVPGDERYYIQYENTGTVPASGVTSLSFPIPAHTSFYRASFAGTPARPGFLPDLIKTAPSDNIIPPAGANGGFLTTGGTATFVINQLPPNAKGYAMVEVIVTSDAVQLAGSKIGVTDEPIVIQDTPQGTTAGIENQALMPIVNVATASSPQTQLLPQTAAGLRPSVTTPAVPQIGIMRIAPTVVTSGSNFDITWLIFNYGSTASPYLDFQSYQPAGATLVQENYTSLYGATFVLDSNSGPVTGVDEETSWNSIPANSAVAVTYTYNCTAGAGNPIVDSNTSLVVDYLGSIPTDPASIAVAVPGTPPPAGNNTQYSPVGRPLYYFSTNSNDVYIIDIGGGNVVAEGASAVVAQGGGTVVTQVDNNLAVYGASSSILIGSTTASFLVANVSDGTALAAVGTSPGSILVPPNTTYIAQPNALIAAAGGGALVGSHGAPIVSSGAGNIVSSGAGNIITQDGGGIVASGAGNLIPKGGAAIVASGAGNIVSTNGSNIVSSGAGNIYSTKADSILPSLAGTASGFITKGNSIVSSGAGNIVSSGAGN